MMPVIAMTREMASLGKDIANGLADRLGLEIVHRELVEHELAERMQAAESEVHRFLEGNQAYSIPRRLGKRRLSYCTAEEILDLAERGNVIIRGWGAAHLLRRITHVVCIRVCAPIEFRIRVLMDRLGNINPPAARHEIDHSDAAHTRAMKIFGSVDWEDPLGYDLVINTERVSIDVGVEQVCALVENPAFQETEASRSALADMLMEARVRTRLNRKFNDDMFGRTIAVSAKSGSVAVRGAVKSRLVKEDTEGIIRGVPGVHYVRNRLIALGSSYSD